MKISMRFDIITIFPEAFESYLNVSVLKRARAKKLIDVRFHTLRDFSEDKRGSVDARPYGGGAGMVLMAPPILKAVGAIQSKAKNPASPAGRQKSKIIAFSAKGKQFNQKLAYDWAKKYKQLILISGRYEGIDERVRIALEAEEISIGPYVLTDGEVASMAVISAVARLIPGVIRLESLAEESHWNIQVKGEVEGRGLEYPHYTRPEVFRWKGKAYSVPAILRSGDHKKIEAWRAKHASW